MTTPCKMQLSEATRQQIGTLEIAIVAPDQYCVDPARNTDLQAFAGTLRLTNTGSEPLAISYLAGQGSILTFRSTKIFEIRHGTPGSNIAIPTYPLSPATVEKRNVTLAPQQSVQIQSWSRHQNILSDVMIEGLGLRNEAIAPDARYIRDFEIEYTIGLEVAGQPVGNSLRVPLRAILPKPQ